MSKKTWYLIQYDIADARRLVRVHRLLKTCSFFVQESVCIWQGSAAELQLLQKRLAALIRPAVDDVRGYRMLNPVNLVGDSPFCPDTYFSGYPPHVSRALTWLEQPVFAG